MVIHYGMVHLSRDFMLCLNRRMNYEKWIFWFRLMLHLFNHLSKQECQMSTSVSSPLSVLEVDPTGSKNMETQNNWICPKQEPCCSPSEFMQWKPAYLCVSPSHSVCSHTVHKPSESSPKMMSNFSNVVTSMCFSSHWNVCVTVSCLDKPHVSVYLKVCLWWRLNGMFTHPVCDLSIQTQQNPRNRSCLL